MKQYFYCYMLFLIIFPVSTFAEDKSTFDLHAAFALTGVGSTFGTVEVNGATLAIEKFNSTSDLDGKKVSLVVEDTQSSNVQTLNAFRKLISFDNAKIIIGPTWLDSYQSVLPIADKNEVMLFTPSAAVVVFKKSSSEYPLVFSTWFNLEVELELLLKHIKQGNKKRIILLFDQDPFFQTIRSIIKKKSSDLDIDIILDESFDLHNSDFRSTLAKTSKMDSDCAIFGFGDESNLLTFLKQRNTINPSLKLFGTDYLDGYVSQDQWVHLFENLDFISPQVQDRVFASEYEERFKSAPVLSASTAFDATSILLQALKANKRTPKAIREYLLSNEFDTVTFGKVRFNDFGGVKSSKFVIKKVREGTITEQPIS